MSARAPFDLAGWQRQPGRRTVQGVVERALSRIDGNRPVTVRGAGRTDAGVHAEAQVADCDVATDADDARLRHSLGRLLPPDVRPVGVRTVPASFSARRHAVSKTYAYTFDFTPWGDPFLARYALHLGRPPDRERLRRALERLPGRRDWSGFTAADTTVRNRVRRVVRAELVDAGPARAAIVFTGDGFLRHMVRNLVGTIVEIERGRMEVERIDRILASGDRRLAGPTAPAHGLCLTEVAYGRATMTPAMMPDEDENEDEDDG